MRYFIRNINNLYHMRKIAVFILGLFALAASAQAPADLKPTESLALFKVLVTNLKDIPSQGDKITFVNPISGMTYTGISDQKGRFNILIPKGERLEVRFLSLGKDSTLRIIDVPNQPGGITMNYTLRYELPRTISLDNVYFDTNKATLKPTSFEALDNLVDLLNYKPTMRIEIGGHTDSQGGAAFNLKLSQGRANSVRAYLASKGIQADRVEAKGYGLTVPIDTNDTPEGRANNRRTEVHILSE